MADPVSSSKPIVQLTPIDSPTHVKVNGGKKKTIFPSDDDNGLPKVILPPGLEVFPLKSGYSPRIRGIINTFRFPDPDVGNFTNKPSLAKLFSTKPPQIG